MLGPAEQDALGDLEEEFRGRVRPNTRWAVAEWWYILESLSLLFAVARGRSSFGRRGDVRTSDITSGEGIMTGMVRDVMHALRGLRREPGTTLVRTSRTSVDGNTASVNVSAS